MMLRAMCVHLRNIAANTVVTVVFSCCSCVERVLCRFGHWAESHDAMMLRAMCVCDIAASTYVRTVVAIVFCCCSCVARVLCRVRHWPESHF